MVTSDVNVNLMKNGWTTCDIKHQRSRGHDFGGTPPLAEIFPYNYIAIPCDCQAVQLFRYLFAWMHHY